MSSYKINLGDRIPTFSIKDQEGMKVSSDDLIGSPFVLYFYPKDDTPGCTKEACSFRDNMEKFDALDTLVIGVSPDGAASHVNFIDKHHLNFTLFSDENLELARKFDAIQEKNIDGKKMLGILRSTFIIDSNGIVRWIERPVNVEGHTERVIRAVHEIIQQTSAS